MISIDFADDLGMKKFVELAVKERMCQQVIVEGDSKCILDETAKAGKSVC